MKTIIKWFNLMQFKTHEIIKLLCLAIISTICYIFLPLSYTKIATNIIIQNYNLTTLWTTINFLVVILNLIISNITKKHITSLNTTHESRLMQKFDSTKATVIITLTLPIYSSLCLILKLTGLIISAGIISLSLALYLVVSICICFTLKKVLNLIKSSDQIILIIIDCVWYVFTFFMILYNIHMVRQQTLSVTTFLVISTFISNHLLKPEFNNNLSRAINQSSIVINSLSNS